MNNNPYIWNAVNPDLFYGHAREQLLDELFKGLSSDSGSPRFSFAIAGARRMGKTTLLRRLEMKLQQHLATWHKGGKLVIPIYIDGQTLPDVLTDTYLWGYLFRELKKVIHQLPVAPDLINFQDFRDQMTRILHQLDDIPRIIVMLDEIELIMGCPWAHTFLSNWRALLSNTPNVSEYFTIVLAGARESSALKRDLGSPLANVIELRSLQNLSFADTCKIMEEPIAHPWSDSFKQLVFKETGGHPMLLQYLMQQVCAGFNQTDWSPEQSVEQAIKDFLTKRRWQFSDWWIKYCTPIAQRIYARLPENGNQLSRRSLVQEFGSRETEEATEILQHIGLIVSEDDGLAFRRVGEMFQRWYKKYAELAETPGHDSQLYDNLANIDSEFAKKYLSAWQIYQKDELSNYSGAVSEIRDTLTLLLHRLAPNEEVIKQPGFKFEKDQHGKDLSTPTRAQRVGYILRQFSKDSRKQVVSDFNVMETLCEKLPQEVGKAYSEASSRTHTTATREESYLVLKKMESVLARLISNTIE